MEYNKSLSARIKRRNAQGYKGNGTRAWVKTTPFGDYKDKYQNHKAIDYKIANDRKSRLGMDPGGYKLDNLGNIIGSSRISKNRQYCKKYADNHQIP